MRLFVALDIDDSVRERIARYIAGVSPFAPDARWASPASLHITLKFIGEQPGEALVPIKTALATVSASLPKIEIRKTGFFPTAKSARVFWVGIEAGSELAMLAKLIDDATASLGIPKEERAFSPHLTLARSRGSSATPRPLKQDKPNREFQLLQERLASFAPPDFGAANPREFFLYQSQLSPKGSVYTKLAAFGLK